MIKKKTAVLVLSTLATVAIGPSVFAYCKDGAIETSLLGCVSLPDGSCGVFMILNIILYVLTAGVGILAMAGIIIAGIQYATAADNEVQVTATKNRIKNIVIGLVLWGGLVALSQWLLPGGIFNQGSNCKLTFSASIPYQQKMGVSKDSVSNKNSNKNSDKNSNNSSNSKKDATNMEAAALLNKTALDLAWPYSQRSKSKNRATPAFNSAMRSTRTNKGESGCRKSGKACGMFVGTVVRYSGLDSNFPTTAYSSCREHMKNSKRWKNVTNEKRQVGDILCYLGGGGSDHIGMVVKNKSGRLVSAQASLCDFYGRVEGKIYTDGRRLVVYRYVGN